MASCPPAPIPGEPQLPTGSWELTKADLSTLLQLSKKLDLNGEVTPVMAWGMVLEHPRLGELLSSAQDVAWLTEELARKIKCYGYVSLN